jgi:phospholipid transport system substrate-binding protein
MMFFIAFAAMLTAAAPAQPPGQIVQHLQHEIRVIDERFGTGPDRVTNFDRRMAATARLIEDTHDLGYMARLTLNNDWSALDDEQRAKFLAAFSELSITSYVARFRDLSGVRFRHVSERRMPRERVEVQTELIEVNGSIVTLNYVLHKTANGWLIINILADGVSELALKRSQYRNIMAEQDFEALLRYIDQQRTNLRQDAFAGNS